ncbi:MAG TPA: response regulator, partial [Tepidisphaeraceae bacterium]
GATFIVTLPTITVPIAPAEPSTDGNGSGGGGSDGERVGGAAAAADGAGKALRILLVEDHEDTRRTLARLLRGRHVVWEVPSVADALAAAAQERFDLVVSDVGLGDASGLDLMRELRRRHPGLRGVALSGFGMEEDVRRSREAGFTHHITKPVTAQALEQILREIG